MKKQKSVLSVLFLLLTVLAFTSCGKALEGQSAGESSRLPAVRELNSAETGNEPETTSSEEGETVNNETSTSSKNVSSKESNAMQSQTESLPYVPKPKDPAVLSEEQENKIKEDYLFELRDLQEEYGGEYSIDGVSITAYYGTYNGSVVLSIRDSYFPTVAAIWDVEVGGINFIYGNGICIWNNGIFYGFTAAYEQGLLTQENLRDIAYYHNGK